MRLRHLVLLLATGLLTTSVQAQQPPAHAAEQLDRLQVELVKRTTRAVVGINCRTNQLSYYGTGAVVDARGWILTNISVIPPAATEIKIFFVDGNVHSARIVEYDVKTESILVAIDDANGKTFDALELADSSKATLGQRVYTFGNPFNVIETEYLVPVAAGSISAIGELVENAEERSQSSYVGPILETDAAINPGSDGGPLVDAGGRLLGIISLGYLRERLLGVCIPAHRIAAGLPSLTAKQQLPPPLEPISVRGKVLGMQARKVAPAIVSLEIERVQEETYKVPSDEELQKMGQERGMSPAELGMYRMQLRLKELMQRPVGFATGLAVLDGRYVLTSAFHLSHNREGKVPQEELPLIRKIRVHAEGMDTPLEAKLVSTYAQWDLALLEVTGGTLPASAKFATKAQLIEGYVVAVLGRQRGSEQVTLTQGIVSAIQRNHNLVKVYQTDALINYANLGGPVIDIEGNVVGLAAFLNPDAGFGINSGVGLFTGSETIESVLADMQAGKSERNPRLPFLGIRAWEDRSIGGACVGSVYGGSAAEAAGVKGGDLIISVDGKPIGEWSDLIRTVTSKAIGQEIEFEVKRGSETLKLRAKLGERPWE